MGRAAGTFFQADHIVCQQLLTKHSVALEIDGTFESYQTVFLFLSHLHDFLRSSRPASSNLSIQYLENLLFQVIIFIGNVNLYIRQAEFDTQIPEFDTQIPEFDT